MLNEPIQQSPLTGLVDVGQTFHEGAVQTVRLVEIPFITLVNLRGNPASPAFANAVQNTIGMTLVTQPNTTTENDDYCVMWLGPDEWMIRSNTPLGKTLLSRLEGALVSTYSSVTDQSSAYCVLQLTGPKSQDLLAKGCPLDLHPRVFGAGQCAQSHYYKTSFLLRRLSDQNQAQWEFIVRRSFADYAVRMLVEGMREYGS